MASDAGHAPIDAGVWDGGSASQFVVIGQPPLGKSVFDRQTELTWQWAPPSITYNWENASCYCSGLVLDGRGWRLPTLEELQALRAVIESVDFANAGGNFWSASLVDGGAQAGVVLFYYPAETSYLGIGEMAKVRCVR